MAKPTSLTTMTNDNHPITPPPELFAEWLAKAKRLHPNESLGFISGQIAQLAYRAGADQELEACCEWLEYTDEKEKLRAARRPNPPSLKEQALAVVENSEICDHLSIEHADILRRALESLPS